MLTRRSFLLTGMTLPLIPYLMTQGDGVGLMSMEHPHLPITHDLTLELFVDPSKNTVLTHESVVARGLTRHEVSAGCWTKPIPATGWRLGNA